MIARRRYGRFRPSRALRQLGQVVIPVPPDAEAYPEQMYGYQEIPGSDGIYATPLEMAALQEVWEDFQEGGAAIPWAGAITPAPLWEPQMALLYQQAQWAGQFPTPRPDQIEAAYTGLPAQQVYALPPPPETVPLTEPSAPIPVSLQPSLVTPQPPSVYEPPRTTTTTTTTTEQQPAWFDQILIGTRELLSPIPQRVTQAAPAGLVDQLSRLPWYAWAGAAAGVYYLARRNK